MLFSSRLFRQLICTASALAILLCLGGCAASTPENQTDSAVFVPSHPEIPLSTTETFPDDPSEPPPSQEPVSPALQQEATGFLRPEVTITLFQRLQPLSLFYTVDAVPVPGELLNQDVCEVMFSVDGSVCSLLTSRNELWMIRDGQLSQIAAYAAYAELSRNGSALIWIDKAGILNHYNSITAEIGIVANRAASAAISPEGGSIAYSVTNPDGSISAWVWTSGEARPFGEEMKPFALAEGASLVYAAGTQDGLLHILDETGTPAGPPCSLHPYNKVLLSSDHLQILFSDDHAWYLRNLGREALQITDHPLQEMVLPEGIHPNSRAPLSFCVDTLPTRNLLGHFYLDFESNLYYLDTDASLSLISQNVYTEIIHVSWDGGTIFYRWEDGTLFRTERCCPGSPTILSSGVDVFEPTGDGRGLYCLDTEKNLWYLEDYHTPKAIAGDVHRMTVTWDDYCLYLTAPEETGGELWASHSGGDGILVLTQVSGLGTSPTASYLYIGEYGHCDVYCATEGISFILLAEDVLRN